MRWRAFASAGLVQIGAHGAQAFVCGSSLASCVASYLYGNISSRRCLSSGSVSPPRQHTLAWKTPNKGMIKFQAYDGELLRTAALREGLVSPHNEKANVINCRGLGTCGTCSVEIEEPIGDRNKVEDFRLSVPPGHNKESSKALRLACQIVVRKDLTITKRVGFWGQYKEMAEPSEPTKPFGQLEYVLDRTSSKSSGGGNEN